MSEIFELPSLGADMDTGTVLEWYVQVGDEVERGSLVALVSTEKADVDVEIWQEGVVAEFLVELGDEIDVGTPLLRLESVTAQAEARGPELAPRAGPEPFAVPATEQTAPPREPQLRAIDRVAASPRARMLAREGNIDLSFVVGTGPGGAVLARDIEGVRVSWAAAVAVDGAAPVDRAEPADRATAMRRAIAERMAKANTEIPHYHLELDIDLASALAWLDDHNRALDIAHRVLPAALLIKAVGVAARAVPELNGNWAHDQVNTIDGSDVAVVVSLRAGGLVTPKISDVADRSVDDVMADLKEVVTSARRGSVRSSWMTGAGITVTNLGDQGADRVHGVIFPPQVALVGFGRIGQRPWVVDGEIVPRPIVTVSLAGDHRATDGAIGSRFLHSLAEYLQHPEAS